MPHGITREEALARLPNRSECLICSLLRSGEKIRTPPLFVSERIAVLLSEYPRFWGQIMVVSKSHVEQFQDLESATWREMNHAAFVAARVLERIIQPARCYIASLGSCEPLPMTCPHLHVNVLPVPSANLPPSEVFTWKNGLFAGTESEWKELYLTVSEEYKREDDLL